MEKNPPSEPHWPHFTPSIENVGQCNRRCVRPDPVLAQPGQGVDKFEEFLHLLQNDGRTALL